MAGIRAIVPKVMVLSIRETEFEKKDDTGIVIETIKAIKVKLHDKSSKTDLEVKYAGTIEEFLNLKIEEYETYTVTLEFSPYSFAGRTNISCKALEFNKNK